MKPREVDEIESRGRSRQYQRASRDPATELEVADHSGYDFDTRPNGNRHYMVQD